MVEQLSRSRIEAAMAECDKLTVNGFLKKHGRGTPKAFWVVSPRRPPDKIYPAKAIAAVALGWENINGGYSTPDSACRVLERAGYKIVDRNGRAYDPEKVLREAVKSIGETERDQIVRQRIGQGLFRDRLLAHAGGECEVTGLKQKELLRASHIKPWVRCDKDEHLDVHNGVLLSSLWDAAFDCGLITFLDDGTAKFSKQLLGSAREALDIEGARRLTVEEERARYLHWHREHCFRR